MLAVVLVVILISSCNDKNSVLIRIKLTNSKGATISLEKLGFSKSALIDSSEVSKGEDNINFKVSSIVEPTFFVVRFDSKDAITLLCEPGEKLDLVVNADNIYDYTVLGSKGSLKTKELSNKLSETKSKLNSLRMKYSSSQDQVSKLGIEKEFNAVIDSQRAYSSRFIWANAMSRASVMAVYQKYDDDLYVLDRPEDLVLFKTVASTLMALYPNSDYTKGMLEEIKKIEKIIRGNNIQNFVKNATQSIPELAIPNAQGRTVKLSALKGKVVLLDFWASWDQNSLLDNRDLLDIYKQYKNLGFEIFQVSVDTNKEEWVNAIESASLPWINVCELNPKGSSAAIIYNVTQLPANYLIDRNQNIIGKNLYGESLRKKLRELF